MSAWAHGRTDGGSGRTAGAGAHLTHDTAHGTDKRRATRHAEGWLDTLQAQRLAQGYLAQVERGVQRAVRLVLLRHVGTEDHLHHAALVVDGEAMNSPLHRVHALLHRDDCLVDLRRGWGWDKG
eukprot:scaffold123985_cov36-Phaeocystis_antarctica.AAC.1